VTAFAVREDLQLYVIGLSSGAVLYHKGDLIRDRFGIGNVKFRVIREGSDILDDSRASVTGWCCS
jgi:hypothetical protein